MLQNVKMSEFQLLLFLSYFENNRRGGLGVGLRLPPSHHPPPLPLFFLQIRINTSIPSNAFQITRIRRVSDILSFVFSLSCSISFCLPKSFCSTFLSISELFQLVLRIASKQSQQGAHAQQNSLSNGMYLQSENIVMGI